MIWVSYLIDVEVTMKRHTAFQGHSADNKIIRIVAKTADPFIKVGVQGLGIREYPKAKMEDLMPMARMTAEEFFNRLY